MMVAHDVVKLDCAKRPYKVVLDNGNALAARAIVIATGAQYNKLGVPNLAKFEGQGVYYGATYMEAQLCEAEDIVVIGGGNSAGQAAVYMSQSARKVHMLVRSGELSDTMSRYLIRRIEENPAIDLHYHTEITALDGGMAGCKTASRSTTKDSFSPAAIWILYATDIIGSCSGLR